jgi:plastocyanin
MSMGLTRRRLYAPVAILAAALIVGAMMIVAGPRATSAQEEESHPAHIHSGTCDTLGEVVYPLTNVGAGSMNAEGTPTAMEQMGSDAATPVEVSVTTVQTDLATLLGADYAINVHESADNIGNYIACGNIGGMVMDGTDLAIGVAELNESGYLGTALLHDNGDGTTTVTVALLEEYGDEGEAEEGTPVASTGSDAAANEVAVDIKDFAFSPDPLEITVGTTVTWTNQDSAPHTATGEGGSFTTGRLDQGQSGSFTFDTAGEFPYFCEFHSNMKGTVVVT